MFTPHSPPQLCVQHFSVSCRSDICIPDTQTINKNPYRRPMQIHREEKEGKRSFSLMQLMYRVSMGTGLSLCLLKKGGRVTTK